MRKLKKLLILSVAAAMSVSALSACSTAFTPASGIPEGEVSSNSGFVVEVGEYVYFVNGVETYTTDNTYGNVVKGALMRAKKTDLTKAETIVPSLMVAADYSSGIYVYGDRVYYATPNNVKNTEGKIENDYLDFKSAKLDGTDVQSYFNVANNATVYRYVESGDSVYLVYALDGTDLYSYNTETRTDTLLAKGVEGYVVSSSDKQDPVIYYTMGVSEYLDTDEPNELAYNQIYSVTADTTVASYEYTFSQEYLDKNNGKAPYVNLGKIVLDGIGQNGVDEKGIATQYTYDLKDGVTPLTPNGYTYELTSYANGGIYFTRSELTGTETKGEGGWLYYLSADKLAGTWNSITGNDAANLDVIAQNTDTANESAIFYKDASGHHYLYATGSVINRADVGANGIATVQRIARNVSGANLMYLDSTSDATYSYVYYNRTNGGGVSVERAVYNGTAENYSNLNVSDAYQPVKLLNVQHVSGWYNYEVINGTVYYVDAEAFGANVFDYVSAVSIKNADGKLMNNAEIVSLNEKYEKVNEYISDLAEEQSKLSTAIKSYYYTGETKYFNDNIKNAIDNGKSEEYLYSTEDQEAFAAYVEGKEGETELAFKDYRTLSAFVTRMGVMSKADADLQDDYWTNMLEKYVVEEKTESFPVWAWILIGVGAAIVVAAAILIPVLVVRAKKKQVEAQPKKKQMEVDTTDDRTVDVYATEETPAETAEEIVEETAEEPATEEVAEEAAEEAPATEEAAEGEEKPSIE